MEAHNHSNTTDANVAAMFFRNISETMVKPGYAIVPLFIFRISNVIAGLALILNIIHIAVITSMPRLRHLADKNFRMYVIYLSSVNIAMMIQQLITDHPEVQQYMHENHWSCVLSTFVLHHLIIYAGWQLFLVSVERLIATLSPSNYAQYFYVRHFIVPLVLVHLAVMGVYGGLGIALHDRAFSVKGSGCCQLSGGDFPKLSLLPSIEGFVITTVITVTYVILLAKSSSQLSRTSSSLKVIRSQSRKRRQVILTIGALLMSKWVGWLPILTALAFRFTSFHKPIIDYIARLFLTGFSLMTPFAYGITTTRYRKFLAKSFANLCAKRQKTSHVDSKPSPKEQEKGEIKEKVALQPVIQESVYTAAIAVSDSITVDSGCPVSEEPVSEAHINIDISCLSVADDLNIESVYNDETN